MSPRSEPEPPLGWAPTHGETQRWVDAYFRHYHSQYPIVHEPTFRAQLSEVIPQPPAAQWMLLMNTVIGLGAFTAGAPMYAVDYFLEQASSVISVDLLETGSLVLVQAYTLLSNLAQKRNKPNAGSTYLGIAVRMAIGLGLHRELPMWNIPPFEREVRRRVWWVLYIFDSGAAITFGRPIVSFSPTAPKLTFSCSRMARRTCVWCTTCRTGTLRGRVRMCRQPPAARQCTRP